jgi:hypothetical protein
LLHGHYPTSSLLRRSPPLVGVSVLSTSWIWPLVSFPLASPTRFSSSVREPRLESRLLYTGHRMDSKQVSSMHLSRSRELTPVSASSENVSMHRRRFACARLSSPHMTRSSSRLFHNVHHRGLASEAAYGCLKPPPAGRLRRVNLHLSYSMVLAHLLDTNSPHSQTAPNICAKRGWAASIWANCRISGSSRKSDMLGMSS